MSEEEKENIILEIVAKPFKTIENNINDETGMAFVFVFLTSLFSGLILSLATCYTFLYCMLASVMLLLLLGFVIKLSIGLFTKELPEYKKVMNVVGYSSLLIFIYEILLIFTILLGPILLVLMVLVIAFLHFSMLITYGMTKISNIDINKAPYAYFIAILIMGMVKILFIL